MTRRLLALVLAGALAPAASAQGLNGFFATGPAGGDPSNFSFSYHLMPVDPVALAVTQFTVLSSNPAAVTVTNLTTGAAVAVSEITPANPLLMPFADGVVFGGGAMPDGTAFPPMIGMPPAPGGAAGPGSTPTLSVTLTNPEGGRAGMLSYLLSDPAGGMVGGAMLPIPDGGWWVLGFAPSGNLVPSNPGDPPPLPDNPTTPTGNPPVVPEPGTLLLAGAGVLGAAGWRRWRRR
jgi:hypothetical protein